MAFPVGNEKPAVKTKQALFLAQSTNGRPFIFHTRIPAPPHPDFQGGGGTRVFSAAPECGSNHSPSPCSVCRGPGWWMIGSNNLINILI